MLAELRNWTPFLETPKSANSDGPIPFLPTFMRFGVAQGTTGRRVQDSDDNGLERRGGRGSQGALLKSKDCGVKRQDDDVERYAYRGCRWHQGGEKLE